MAKKAEQNTLQSKEGRMVLQQQVISDDSLLPPASELEKLNSVSPEIVPWILKRTEMEQDARIEFNKERIKLAKSDSKHVQWYNFVSLSMAFIIAIAFILFSFYLVANGSTITGSIFAGGTIVLIISYFFKSRKSSEN